MARAQGARGNGGSAPTGRGGGEALPHRALGQRVPVHVQDSQKQQAGMAGMSRNPGVVYETYQKLRGDSWDCGCPGGQGWGP